MDVKYAVVNGYLLEEVYVEQPSSFKNITYADYVLRSFTT